MGRHGIAYLVAALALALAPLAGAYPIFLMKLLCFALLAGSLNLMIGYVGLLSFGHAMFFGSAAYAAAQSLRDDPLSGSERRCVTRPAAGATLCAR